MAIIEIKTPAEFRELLKGKRPVVVKFSAEWCPDCETLRPHFEGHAEELERAGIAVARFSLSKDRFNAGGVKRTIYLTPEHEEIRNRYVQGGFPTVALIKDGRVLASSVEDTEKSFRHFVSLALSKAK